jgi:hypothetical protein
METTRDYRLRGLSSSNSTDHECLVVLPANNVAADWVVSAHAALLAVLALILLRFLRVWWTNTKTKLHPIPSGPQSPRRQLSPVALKVAGCCMLAGVSARKIIGEQVFPCWVYRVALTFASLGSTLPHAITLAQLMRANGHDGTVLSNQRNANKSVRSSHFATVTPNAVKLQPAHGDQGAFTWRVAFLAGLCAVILSFFVHTLLPITWYCDGGCLRTNLHFGVSLLLGTCVLLTTAVLW